MSTSLRAATVNDVSLIRELIEGLAEYERLRHECRATDELLRASLFGERAYADYARRLLLAYAKLYPTLGDHPAKANESVGRLFWQSLNDSVWLVYSVQGYDAIRDTLSAADRKTIDDNVFRRAAAFLSTGSPEMFDRIHNHATWACAGVGMTGYVLRDPNEQVNAA